MSLKSGFSIPSGWEKYQNIYDAYSPEYRKKFMAWLPEETPASSTNDTSATDLATEQKTQLQTELDSEKSSLQ